MKSNIPKIKELSRRFDYLRELADRNPVKKKLVIIKKRTRVLYTEVDDALIVSNINKNPQNLCQAYELTAAALGRSKECIMQRAYALRKNPNNILVFAGSPEGIKVNVKNSRLNKYGARSTSQFISFKELSLSLFNAADLEVREQMVKDAKEFLQVIKSIK